MTDIRKGVLALIAACAIWGLSGLFYKALSDVPSHEVLAHRTVWSLVFFGFVLGVQGRLNMLWGAVANPVSCRVIAAAALLISVNWFLFIWSIQVGRATEASMGYYIFPLVAVLIGRIVLGERLSRLQWVAISLAAAGVLSLTIGLHILPWISLVLASTFGLYGLIKKRLDLGPVVSVSAEVLLLCPLGLGWLIYLHTGQGFWARPDTITVAHGSGANHCDAVDFVFLRRSKVDHVDCGHRAIHQPNAPVSCGRVDPWRTVRRGTHDRLRVYLVGAGGLFQQRLHSGQGAAQGSDGFGSRSGGFDKIQQRCIRETLIDHMIQQRGQGRPVFIDT